MNEKIKKSTGNHIDPHFFETKRNDTDVVRRIILEKLTHNNRVSRHYVREMIMVRITHTLLHTKAISRQRDCEDGIKNIERGAGIVFSDSWKQLNKDFEMDKEGWISLRQDHEAGELPRSAFTVACTGNVEQLG